MPTGYTANLYDGKPQTFPEFALGCARAYEPDAPIPTEGEHVTRALHAAQERLATVLGWSDTDATAAADGAYTTACTERDAAVAVATARRDRYEAMLADVKAWEPPTPDHTALKTFMANQLSMSISTDCGVIWWPEPVRVTAHEYRLAETEEATTDIAYYAKQVANERDRAAQRTEWVRQLRAAL